MATQWTFAVEKTIIYEVKYRVRNSIGWSDYSPVAMFTASDYPSRPEPLQLVSVSATDIVLNFDLE